MEHDPPLSSLPNGHCLEKGFELANDLLKLPREPLAKKVPYGTVQLEHFRKDDSYFLFSWIKAALQKHQPASIQPGEASQVALSIAASWEEAAGLTAELGHGSEGRDTVRRQERAAVEHDGASDASVDMEHVILHHYTRWSKEFAEALLLGPDLRPIREEMQAAGHDCILEPSGAKMFVPPQHVEHVKRELAQLQIPLHASHVVVTESMLPALERSIATISSMKNVRVKDRRVLTVMPSPTQGETDADYFPNNSSPDWLVGVKRTFICSVRVVRNPESVNQSTTEAHGGVNPRR